MALLTDGPVLLSDARRGAPLAMREYAPFPEVGI